ncbi:MAG: hypothetical protein ACPL7J_08715, partial [Desulfomonilaceae bacterium]
MQTNYGAYGMQPPQQYLTPPQQQPAPVQQTVAPARNPGTQRDRSPRSIRARGNPPAPTRPSSALGT